MAWQCVCVYVLLAVAVSSYPSFQLTNISEVNNTSAPFFFFSHADGKQTAGVMEVFLWANRTRRKKKREKKRGRGVTTAFSLSFPPSLFFFIFKSIASVCTSFFFLSFMLSALLLLLLSFFFFFEVDFFFSLFSLAVE